MILKLVLVLSIATTSKAAEVCYGDLGCFTDEPPYSGTPERPVSFLPQDPRVINTQFLLLTRKNPDRYQVISARNVSSIADTNFQPSKKSIFVVHGFAERGDQQRMTGMCQNLLKKSDANCFSVDWSGGSNGLYGQVSNNLRVIGVEIAFLLKYEQIYSDHQMQDVHLIGEGLGAHAVGEAGKRQKGIGRITGLNPAGPYFENTPPEVRLDSTDAAVVDVIHTDGPIDALHLGFGIQQTVGNVDYFPNGGINMPGCEKTTFLLEDIDNIIKGDYEKIFCNHHRSYELFTESILRPGGFIGYRASSYKDFQEGSGFPCIKESCAFMGYKANNYVFGHDQDSTNNHKFFLNTGNPSNFPRFRYSISVTITGWNFVLGSISVALCGDNGCSSQHEIYSGLLLYRTYSSFIDLELDVNPVQMVKFSWHKRNFSIFQSKLGASAVTVQYGPSGETYKFCGAGLTKEDTSQTLEECSTF